MLITITIYLPFELYVLGKRRKDASPSARNFERHTSDKMSVKMSYYAPLYPFLHAVTFLRQRNADSTSHVRNLNLYTHRGRNAKKIIAFHIFCHIYGVIPSETLCASKRIPLSG